MGVSSAELLRLSVVPPVGDPSKLLSLVPSDAFATRFPNVGEATTFIGVEGALRGQLLVLAPEGQRLGVLEVAFTERLMSPQQAVFFGSDGVGVLHVTCEISREQQSSTVNLTARLREELTAVEVLPAIEFMHRVHSPNRWALQLVIDDQELSLGEPEPVPLSDSIVPDAYLEAVSLLARVQHLAATEFPLPDNLSEGELQGLREADALLHGERVTGRWTEAAVAVSDEGLEFFRTSSQDQQFRMEMTADYSLVVGTHTLRLGRVTRRLLAARVSSTDEDTEAVDGGAVVNLVPGANDLLETELVNPPKFAPFDRLRRDRFSVMPSSEKIRGEPGALERLRQVRRDSA